MSLNDVLPKRTHFRGRTISTSPMELQDGDWWFDTHGLGSGLFVGTYTGDGAPTLSITGVGFTPVLVWVWSRFNWGNYGIKTDRDGVNSAFRDRVLGTYRYQADMLVSIDADGFTVGDGTPFASNVFNINAGSYGFACFGSGALTSKTGTYLGDGNHTQSIIGMGFSPRLVTIFCSGTAFSVSPFAVKSYLDGTYAHYFRNAGDFFWDEDVIISLDADGFTVGDGSHVGFNDFNNLAATGSYRYICWK